MFLVGLRKVVKIAHSFQRLLLPGVALFAMLWVVARAHVQAVTMDEAVTYTNFVALQAPTHWIPHANNHVLNSMLIRLFTSIFGVSHVTVRSGALIGAAVYIFVAYQLSKLIARDFLLRLSLFLCLVYNPFVFDFMVAARGYGLATAFLACAIWVVAFHKREATGGEPNSLLVACCLSSVLAGLSFVSNFAFAIADAAAMLMLYLWTCRAGTALEPDRAQPAKRYAKLAAACALPGLLVATLLAGSTILEWPKDQLVYGAESLRETFSSIAEASLYEPNPYLISPLFYHGVTRLSAFILPLLGALCAWRLIHILFDRSRRPNVETRWLLGFSAVLAGTIAATLSVHWLAFRLFRVLLPKDRTAIYLVVLITLFAGILAAVPFGSKAGDVSRRSLTAALFILGVFFVLCLRLNYFKEWKWDSDVNRVYSVLAYYNHTCGLKDISTNWRYDASLNFYRATSGRETIYQFPGSRDYPPGKRAYVLYYPEDQGFIFEHGLKVVYRGQSDATVVIDPAAGCETDHPPAGIGWGRN